MCGNNMRYDVSAFGADPTGKADSTAAFQAAITETWNYGGDICGSGVFLVGNLAVLNPNYHRPRAYISGQIVLAPGAVWNGAINLFGSSTWGINTQNFLAGLNQVRLTPSVTSPFAITLPSHSELDSVYIDPVGPGFTSIGILGASLIKMKSVSINLTAAGSAGIIVDGSFWLGMEDISICSDGAATNILQFLTEATSATFTGIVRARNIILYGGSVLIKSASKDCKDMVFEDLQCEVLPANCALFNLDDTGNPGGIYGLSLIRPRMIDPVGFSSVFSTVNQSPAGSQIRVTDPQGFKSTIAAGSAGFNDLIVS